MDCNQGVFIINYCLYISLFRQTRQPHTNKQYKEEKTATYDKEQIRKKTKKRQHRQLIDNKMTIG